MRRASCFLGLCALLSAARNARSDEPAATLALNWMRVSGAESCLDAGKLARSVERHLGRSVFVNPATATRNIEGWIEPARPGWHVALRASDESGRPIGHRELASTDESCASLDRSIVIAVGLLAEAAQGAVAASSVDVDSPVPMPRDSPLPAVREAPPAVNAAISSEPIATPAFSADAELGPSVSVASGVLPHTAFGVGLNATVRVHRLWIVDFGSQLWLPQKSGEGSVSGTFARSDLALGACLTLLHSPAAQLGACAGIDGGLVTVHGAGTKVASSEHRPVFSGYGQLTGEVGISRWVWLGAAGTVGVPTARWTFYHRTAEGTEVDIWSMPAITFGGQLSLVVRFGS